MPVLLPVGVISSGADSCCYLSFAYKSDDHSFTYYLTKMPWHNDDQHLCAGSNSRLQPLTDR